MQRAKQKGFTLIELLVVIAIISVLLGVVVITLNPLERIKESRDNRRQQDIQSVKKALDLALVDGEVTINDVTSERFSSVAGTSVSTDTNGQTTGWVQVTVVSGKDGLSKYMAALPDDPQGSNAPGQGYGYKASANDDCYQIATSFETTKYQTDFYTSDGGDEATRYEIGTCVATL